MVIKSSLIRKVVFAISSLFFSFNAQAQHPYEVHGYVVDAASGQILKNVVVKQKNTIVGRSNDKGYYIVSVPPYSNTLLFEHDAYSDTSISLEINADTTLNINLVPIDYRYDKFQEFTAHNNRLNEMEAGKLVADLQQLELLPQLGDEPDLFRSLHKLPGVDLGNEINAALNIRGGSNDQNLILYNGIQVYKPTQLFNTLSFQLSPVEEASLYRGAAPARFGGRLSSVIDIRSLDGIAKEQSADFSLSLTSAKFRISTPIKQDKSSMTLSVRRSYIDLLFPGLFFDGDNAFNFYDINFKFNREFDNKARMSVFSLFTKDNLLLSFEDSDTAGGVTGTTTYKNGIFTYNYLGGFDFEKQLKKNLYAKFSAAYSGNALRLFFSEQNLSQPQGFPVLSETHFNFGNYDIVLNADFSSNHNNKHHLNYGTNVIYHTYATGVLVERNEDNLGNELESETTGESQPLSSTEIAFYGEDTWQVSDKLSIIGGLRLVYYNQDGYSPFLVEPRLRSYYRIDDKTAWRISYARNNQFSHFISYASGNFLSARWVPATENAQVQNSNIVTTGISRQLKSGLVLDGEAYYKQMNNILISEDGFINDILNWENLIIPGEGRAYGFETFIQGTKKHFAFMASYGLSWAQRRYDGINSDQFFNYDFDRRHMLKSNFSYIRGNDDVIAVNYLIGSGRPFSVPNSKYRDIDGRIILGYDEINNYRSKFYHRIDLSYTRYTFRNLGVESFFKFTLYNAFMNQNASQLFVELDKTVQQGIVYKANSVSYLVFIPSLSYNLKF